MVTGQISRLNRGIAMGLLGAVAFAMVTGCGEGKGGRHGDAAVPRGVGLVSTQKGEVGADRPSDSQPSTLPAAAQDAGADVAGESRYAGYFWVMPREQRERFVGIVNDLPFGTSKAECIRRLGKPVEQGEGRPLVWPPRRHLHYLVTYAIAEYREDLVTSGKDQRLSLWFDWQNRLEYVRSDYPAIKSRKTADADEDDAMSGWWDMLEPTARPSSDPAK